MEKSDVFDRGEFIALTLVGAVAAVAINEGAASGYDLPIPSSVAGIRIPDTTAAREAVALARSSVPRELFNHSLRSYLFAELIGRNRNLDHDTELLFVAAILHDLGLSDAHMSASNRFEIDSALAAKDILLRHGFSDSKQTSAWDAITLHYMGPLAKWKGPEAVLLNAGVNADFGSHLSEMQGADIIEALKAAPRDNFAETFISLLSEVARKKPATTYNASFIADIGYKYVPGFHLGSFADGLTDDPFAGFHAQKSRNKE